MALLANLVFPPVGHLYVGEARRGILLWLIIQAVTALMFVPIRLAPGLAAVLVAITGVVGLGVVLPIDGFVLARQRRSAYVLRRYNRWYVYVAIAALALLVGSLCRELVRTQVQAFRIPSEAMRPTLLVGDFLFVDKVSHRAQGFRRGDLVVFPYPQDPTKDFIKRLIATGGETVEIRNKQVMVNGIALEEAYAIHADPAVRPAGYEYRDNYGPYTVPPGELFVMGDHRDNSNDSRYWGTLPERSVKGKAVVIYWSWDGSESRPRWSRVGMRLR